MKAPYRQSANNHQYVSKILSFQKYGQQNSPSVGERTFLLMYSTYYIVEGNVHYKPCFPA